MIRQVGLQSIHLPNNFKGTIAAIKPAHTKDEIRQQDLITE